MRVLGFLASFKHMPTTFLSNIPFLSNPKFDKFYGFTENEVQNSFEKLHMTDRINDIRLWYDGYKELETNDKDFNVYDIIRCLESSNLGRYWAQSGGVKNIDWLFAHHLVLKQVEKSSSS